MQRDRKQLKSHLALFDFDGESYRNLFSIFHAADPTLLRRFRDIGFCNLSSSNKMLFDVAAPVATGIHLTLKRVAQVIIDSDVGLFFAASSTLKTAADASGLRLHIRSFENARMEARSRYRMSVTVRSRIESASEDKREILIAALSCRSRKGREWTIELRQDSFRDERKGIRLDK